MRRPTVVVVEDEPLIRLAAVDAIEEAGFEVVDFSSADDAIDYAQTHGSEVVGLVTDVRLPGEVDGVELAQHVDQAWPHIATLVTSGHCAGSDSAELPAHATFLTKPWRGRDIARWLRDHVEGGTSVR